MTKKKFEWDVCEHDVMFYENGEVIDYDDVVGQLNKLYEENQELIQKKNDLKELLMNSEPVLEQKELQKIIHKRVCAAIDDKIEQAEKSFEKTQDNWYLGQVDGVTDLKKEIEQW